MTTTKRVRRLVARRPAQPALNLDDVARRAIARHDDKVDEMKQMSFDAVLAWTGRHWEPDET